MATATPATRPTPALADRGRRAPRPSAATSLPRLAAVDIGTNSIRLVIAEVQPDGSYRVLDQDREMSRLGRGFYATGRIAEGPFEQALSALGRMKAIAEGFGVAELRAIATSAVREAANGAEFVREAWRRTKVRIEVVSGDDEARLAFRSVARHYDLGGRLAAIVDIGGGSAEVILAAGGVIEQMCSLPLGAVRLTEQYVTSDPLRAKDWRSLRRAIDAVIDEGLGKPPFAAEVMIGSGGTFTNLAEMAQAERDGRVSQGAHDYALSRAEVKRLVDRLRETPLEARRKLPGLNPLRADIMVAGAAVVSRLARHLDTQRVLVNDRGVRDGVLLSMIEELTGASAPRAPAADRMEVVRRFARACRSNERHCSHVATLATQLFDALREAYALPPTGRDIVQAAALLHDIGYLINHEEHHKHAYHLILHGDLRGFTAREIELIANVARYHRRAVPRKAHANFARLDKGERRLVRRLSGILRIADGLDRTHGQIVTGVRCRVRDGSVRLQVRATSDPSIDIEDAKRKAGLFERAFRADLTFAAARA